jgi:hypothetical protein
MATLSTDPHEDERRQLRRACEDLVVEFRDTMPVEEVQRRFEQVVHRFDGAPVRTFVPVLAGRAAREDLRRRARV